MKAVIEQLRKNCERIARLEEKMNLLLVFHTAITLAAASKLAGVI